MTAANKDITIEKGSTFTLPIILREKGCQTGIDLSSATISGYVYPCIGSPSQYNFSIVSVDLINGKFNIVLSNTDTSNLNLTNNVGKYIIKIDYGSTVDYILKGNVYLIEVDE